MIPRSRFYSFYAVLIAGFVGFGLTEGPWQSLVVFVVVFAYGLLFQKYRMKTIEVRNFGGKR